MKEKFAYQCMLEIQEPISRRYTIQWLEEKYCKEGNKLSFKDFLNDEWTVAKVYGSIKMSSKYVRVMSVKKDDGLKS